MTEWFIKGGPFMWPLLVVFIIGIIIAVVKGITLLSSGVNAGELMQRVKAKIASEGVTEAAKLITGDKPVEAVISSCLKQSVHGLDAAEKAVINEGGLQSTYLDKGMIWLSTVVALGPLLGFLGTVSGMVGAMDAIKVANDISPSVVAGGISEALITTEAGLIIAIIIQTAQNFYSSIIDNRVLAMEETSVALIETLTEIETAKK